MASPADPSHPLTPPAETQSTHIATTQQAPTNSQHDTQTSSQSRVEALLSEPLTSLTDNGTSKRPRDHRLIHLLLAAYGVNAYQERVPLQLMDFAYRYTSAVLSDAIHIQQEGYDQSAEGAGASKGRGGGKNAKNSEEGEISLAALRMSIQSRLGYQFSGSLPKEFLKQMADEKNRIALAPAVKDGEKNGPAIGGVRLPHERYCMTGLGWGLRDEWESEGEESIEEDNANASQKVNGADENMQVDVKEDEDDLDEEGAGRMEDVFGQDDGDTEMQS